jgi:enoyl-[acyl-carrier-protein] reductase (NADH)
MRPGRAGTVRDQGDFAEWDTSSSTARRAVCTASPMRPIFSTSPTSAKGIRAAVSAAARLVPVAPGIINAGLGEQFRETMFAPEIWAAQRKRVPLKRFGEAAEIAATVAFLASNRSSYISGQTIVVDGGLSL